MSEFFEMGGYAAYVWPAYGIVALVMIALLVRTLQSVRANEKTLASLEASGAKRIHEKSVAPTRQPEERDAS